MRSLTAVRKSQMEMFNYGYVVVCTAQKELLKNVNEKYYLNI